jgi:hypothetical protein
MDGGIRMSTFSLVCPGNTDEVATLDYWGPQEDEGTFPGEDPSLTSHAAALELVWKYEGAPADEKFAVAWIPGGGGHAQVRIYDRKKDRFLQTRELNILANTRWISKLGYDIQCGDVSGAQSCGWFTWQGQQGQSAETVMWRAVGDNNQLGPTHIGYPGYSPSGETGTYGVKLLAWIELERLKVMGIFLDERGQPIGAEFVINNVPSPFKAYQTSVAYSLLDEKWLVAWEESAPFGSGLNGRLKTKWVELGGSMGPSNHIMYCNQQNPLCYPGLAGGGQAAPLATNCSCHGFWLASSQYSESTEDRYRLHHYGDHARLNRYGQLVGRLTGAMNCSTCCPMTESNYWHRDVHTPFQMLYENLTGEDRTDHRHLVQGDETGFYDEGYAVGAHCRYPQAARSGRTVSAAVSGCNEEGHVLRLSLTDLYEGGCWQYLEQPATVF